jgi:Phytanoyl-CoA dioxygenase (PhyH)
MISECYAHAVDDQFQQICSGSTLPSQSLRQLVESGFVVAPGPVSGEPLNELTAAYDEVMAVAAGPDFKIASTTNRMSDLLTYGSVFHKVYLYPPLLEACGHIIGEPFKLSSFLARTLRGGTPAQELHADLARGSEDAPLLGFILMIDSFREENGATRFVPTSHNWNDLPCDRLSDARAKYSGEVLGCGERGTMIIFNGAIWHGHTANVTPDSRRSIQGYFVRRSARSGFDFRNRLPPAARSRLSPLAHYLLALDEETL